MGRHILVVSLLMLSACQGSMHLGRDSDGDFPPAGSRLVVRQPITIPAETSHATFQGGQQVGWNQVNVYQPHCEIEVLHRRDRPQIIEPDEFDIRRAYHENRTSQAGRLFRAEHRIGSAASPHIVYRTILELSSKRQPDVRWLTCIQWGDAALGSNVTLAEIRQALGTRLEVAGPE